MHIQYQTAFSSWVTLYIQHQNFDTLSSIYKKKSFKIAPVTKKVYQQFCFKISPNILHRIINNSNTHIIFNRRTYLQLLNSTCVDKINHSKFLMIFLLLRFATTTSPQSQGYMTKLQNGSLAKEWSVDMVARLIKKLFPNLPQIS